MQDTRTEQATLLLTDLKGYIDQALQEMATNQMAGSGIEQEQLWGSPLIGLARGDDDLFPFFKKSIGDFYFLPQEAFVMKYPGYVTKPLTVMSLAFPHTEQTLQAQRVSTRFPSDRWRYSRQFWPEFAAEMSSRITSWLADQGIRSVDPERLPAWSWQTSDAYGYASNWSQRHTAYAAGLGTFGLCDGLITEKGKAVRFLSFVLEADLPPSARDYTSRRQWCLHDRDGNCGLCITRCPAQAISAAGHDKARCAAYCQSINQVLKPGPGQTAGCGLCQADVPCEHSRPQRVTE
ncbi:MAG: epoxyqueuosine reductase [Eubacteriales bacterium]|nr:epoxyqueuosine reductase [Eubacteriales bacterium]MDD4139704.1 epoxyqueuosine reductase [Eubacteriales bacterium]MDD4743610.1 epoxyqueuosine reductase [Eubacteriales bacterium]